MDWFYALGNEQRGPVSAAELRALFDSGQISGENLVWQEGMSEWQPLSTVAHNLPEAAEPSFPGAASAASMARETGSCSVCGKSFPGHDLSTRNGQPICTSCGAGSVSTPTVAPTNVVDWGPCDVGNIWNQSWATFQQHASQLIIGTLVAGFSILGAALLGEGLKYMAEQNIGVLLATWFATQWVQAWLGIGMFKYILNVLDYGESSLGTIYAYPFQAVTVAVAAFLVGIAGIFGLLLLIVPGVYIFCRCYLLTLIAADEEVGGFAALNACWERTGPYVLQIFLVWIVQMVIIVLGVLALFVGLIVAAPLSICMMAVTYRTIQPKQV
jgi:hypothetical protein